jgi:hypothetical protein
LELFEAKPSFSNSKNKSNTDNKIKHGRFWRFLLLFIKKVNGRKIETGRYLPKEKHKK